MADVKTGVKMGLVAPNQPKTPIHNFRIPPEIWEPAAKRAAERGETLTDVVRRALEDYAR